MCRLEGAAWDMTQVVEPQQDTSACVDDSVPVDYLLGKQNSGYYQPLNSMGKLVVSIYHLQPQTTQHPEMYNARPERHLIERYSKQRDSQDSSTYPLFCLKTRMPVTRVGKIISNFPPRVMVFCYVCSMHGHHIQYSKRRINRVRLPILLVVVN